MKLRLRLKIEVPYRALIAARIGDSALVRKSYRALLPSFQNLDESRLTSREKNKLSTKSFNNDHAS